MVNTVLLDRDGIINKKRNDYVKSWEEFEFIPGVDKSLKLLTSHGYKIIIITNQSVINRKIITDADLNKIHNNMINALQKKTITIDGIFVCPHTPEEECDCRKPKTGMIERALSEFNLQPSDCVLIGDSDTDIEAGTAMGIKSYLLKDKTLLEISQLIIKES